MISNHVLIYLSQQDPHFVGVPKDSTDLINRGYVKWQRENEFVDQSFYNLCMPKLT